LSRGGGGKQQHPGNRVTYRLRGLIRYAEHYFLSLKFAPATRPADSPV
jgi:hypothetical protein